MYLQAGPHKFNQLDIGVRFFRRFGNKYDTHNVHTKATSMVAYHCADFGAIEVPQDETVWVLGKGTYTNLSSPKVAVLFKFNSWPLWMTDEQTDKYERALRHAAMCQRPGLYHCWIRCLHEYTPEGVNLSLMQPPTRNSLHVGTVSVIERKAI